jgi:hypothetical protein
MGQKVFSTHNENEMLLLELHYVNESVKDKTERDLSVVDRVSE